MKKRNRITAVVLSILMACTALVPSVSAKEATASDFTKDETAYVILNPDGSVKEQSVSCWLHSDNGFSSVKDESNLSDITPIKGDVTSKISGSSIQWNTDEHDVYYTGTSNATPPISVKITYKLDGKEIKAEDLAGKSGKLTMTIKLTNNEKQTKDINGQTRIVYTPIAADIVMNLPTDTFQDVKADDTEIITESSNQIVNFVALPGVKENFDGILTEELNDLGDLLTDTFTVEANVTDFEMPLIAIAATTSLENLKDINLNDTVTQLTDGMDELSEASSELQEGTKLISEAMSQFDTQMGTFQSKYGEFSDGIDKALKGVNRLSSGTQKLQSASSKLKGKVTDELVPGIENSASMQKELTDKMDTLKQQLSEANIPDESEIQKLQQQLSDLVDGVFDASANAGVQVATGNAQTTKTLSEQQKQALAAAKIKVHNNSMKQVSQILDSLNLSKLSDIETTLGEIDSLSSKLMTSVTKLTTSLYDPNDDPKDPKTVANAIIAISVGADEVNAGAGELSDGLNTIDGFSGQIENAIDSFKQASSTLSDKSGELSDGMTTFKEDGIDKLCDKNTIRDLEMAVAIKDEMQKQAEEYRSYSGAPENADTTVKFVMKTTDLKEHADEQSVKEEPKKDDSFLGKISSWFSSLFD